MALRYTDTELWNKDWFLDLEPKQKLLTYFLYANCDCAGFFEISWSKIKFFFAGAEITKADFLKIKSLIFISDDVIFLQDFILEQQKIKSLDELNLLNNAHKGILKKIDFYNKIYNFSPLPKGLTQGATPSPLPKELPLAPIGNMVKGNMVRGKKNNQQSNKEKREINKEKEENFQNSDFEINEINETNETNETKQPLKFADLPENLRVCGIYGNNALLEEEKGEDFEKNSETEEVCNAPPPKKNEENDIYFFYSKIRAVYEDIIGKQGAYLNDTQVHDLYRLYLSTDDFMETLNDTLKELANVQKIFKKKIGYSPGLDWIVKADGKNYSTLRNKSFTGLEEENKKNEVFQITI